MIDLKPNQEGKLKHRREPLPDFVIKAINEVKEAAGVDNGVPDLAIWNPTSGTTRMVEVKHKGRDALTAEQAKFERTANKLGIPTTTIEWILTK